MSYIPKVLTDNETILYSAAIHPIFLFWHGVLAVLFIAMGVFMNGLFLFSLLVIALMTHPYWTTEIAVTNRRLIYKQGLFARDVQEILLNKIEGINIEQTVLGRILNYGAVRVRGVGIGEIALPRDMDNPLEFKKAMDNVRI